MSSNPGCLVKTVKSPALWVAFFLQPTSSGGLWRLCSKALGLKIDLGLFRDGLLDFGSDQYRGAAWSKTHVIHEGWMLEGFWSQGKRCTQKMDSTKRSY